MQILFRRMRGSYFRQALVGEIRTFNTRDYASGSKLHDDLMSDIERSVVSSLHEGPHRGSHPEMVLVILNMVDTTPKMVHPEVCPSDYHGYDHSIFNKHKFKIETPVMPKDCTEQNKIVLLLNQ